MFQRNAAVLQCCAAREAKMRLQELASIAIRNQMNNRDLNDAIADEEKRLSGIEMDMEEQYIEEVDLEEIVEQGDDNKDDKKYETMKGVYEIDPLARNVNASSVRDAVFLEEKVAADAVEEDVLEIPDVEKLKSMLEKQERAQILAGLKDERRIDERRQKFLGKAKGLVATEIPAAEAREEKLKARAQKQAAKHARKKEKAAQKAAAKEAKLQEELKARQLGQERSVRTQRAARAVAKEKIAVSSSKVRSENKGKKGFF